jgi:thiamine biosynthesis lipoprotein
MERIEFRAMGCQMLAVLDSESGTASQRLALVPEWFAVWEQRLSRFREDSELSRVNAAPDLPFHVSPVLWNVLQTAMRAARETDGLVVPTLLEALEAAGYDRTFEALPLTGVLQRAASPTRDWREIEMDPTSRSVRLPGGIRLDLGGIAKGWAADRAARRLAGQGPSLVDAGGDIAVSGPQASGLGWPVGVADPAAEAGGVLETLRLVKGGVATSGRDYHRWQREGVWQHHILDPRTGLPAETDVLSATVVAPSARQAEIAAKVTLILGSNEGLNWLEAHPSLAGLLVLQNGQVVHSRRLKQYLWR